MATTAKVRLTLEIEMHTRWENSCSALQIYKQASIEASRVVTDMIIASTKLGDRAKLVGNPEVDVIIHTVKAES
jgi:hypothetical protein